MADRLAQVAAEIAKLDGEAGHAPSSMAIWLTSPARPAEYEQFAQLIEPLRTAGLPVHLGLGNHDNFTHFAAGLARLRPQDKPVEGKQVVVVELDRVNLFVLDSYDPKIGVGGSLGEAQLKWLAKALDARQTQAGRGLRAPPAAVRAGQEQEVQRSRR